MTPIETNVFLTRAALLDPRMKRSDPLDQADMADAWATVLEDVGLEDALAALAKHYRASTTAIMPANVVELVGIVDEAVSPIPDITHEVLAESRARTLAAAGVTEAEFAEHENDIPWLHAHFPPQAEIVGEGYAHG